MVFFSIFLIPFILCFNAFCIGRIFKRFYIIENSNLCTVVGFFTYICGVYLLSIILYLVSSTILLYGIIFLIVQVFLIALYAANWRYFFISWNVNSKLFIAFFSVFILSIIICFLNMRNYVSPAAIQIIPIFENTNNLGWDNVISLSNGSKESTFYSNYSSLNIFNMFWMNVFKFNATDLPIFINWYPAILISFLVANLCCYFSAKTTKIYLVIVNCIFSLAIVVFPLMFIETFFIGSTWTLFIIVCYLLILFSNTNSPLKLIFLAISIFALETISEGSTLIVMCLYLFTIWYVVKVKGNIIQYVVFLLLPLLIEICWILITPIGWFTLLILFIELVIFAALMTLTLKEKYAIKILKINKWLSVNLKFLTYFFIIIVAIAIIIFMIVFTKNNDFKNLFISVSLFNYDYLWNINLNMNNEKLLIINVVLFAIYAAIFILVIIYIIYNKNYINFAPEVSLIILSFIALCNPFSISLFYYLNVIIMPDVGVSNCLIFAPLMLICIKMLNCKSIKPKECNYEWY